MSDADLNEMTEGHLSMAHAATAVDLLTYIEPIAGELSRMATRGRFPLLAYLLAMARLEAERTLKGSIRAKDAAVLEMSDAPDPDARSK